MKTDVIREKYLNFFKQRGHTVVASDSLVPANDPSLLFTGAGMNQFKEMFLGRGKMPFTRATSSQKCIRTGDIENVGRTAAHHTFFEMLGNFSFGDYFKREAITWAWEFLTKELAIPQERLSVSVYKDDQEAYDIWANEVKVPPERIFRFGAKDNFWPANAVVDGPNGPCGPCSEIFFDQGVDIGCRTDACNPSCSCDRYVEIWNLVFTQFDRRDGGVLEPLPQKNIDTGMGLERIASVMQGKLTNFEIDIFQPLLAAIGEMTGARYGSSAEVNRRIRRISDHTRAVSFVIADGVMPSNEGRGYVMRRLLRRAVSDGIYLGARDNFLYKLAPVVAQVMAKPYPEITERRENIAMVIKAEEEKFHDTLVAGQEMLDRLIASMKAEGRKVITGEEAFKFYDTFGYPVEFLLERAADEGLEVDSQGFDNEMNAQRQRARQGSNMAADIFASARGPVHDLAAAVPATRFEGYERTRIETRIVGMLKTDSTAQEAGAADGELAVVLAATPFYAESGGQVGDTGFVRGDGFVFEVRDTRKAEGLTLHIGKVSGGTAKVGAEVVAEVDAERRAGIERNHTATHLLQYALRKRLGEHVEQSGSLVTPERLRFDFTHIKALTRQEIREVEATVNDTIMENIPVMTSQTSLDDARRQGVIALFGEKYGEVVRVVRVGEVSAELCGGTHLERAGSTGFFKIVGEESVAQGVRRITAVTGRAAVAEVHGLEGLIEEVASVLDAPPSRLVERAKDTVAEVKRLRKEAEKAAAATAVSGARDFASKARGLVKLRVIAERIDGLSVDDLRRYIDALKGEKSLVTILGSAKDDKVTLIIAATPDLVKAGLSAVDIVKSVAGEIKGGGGGRPDMAQAGGKDASGLDRAIARAVAAVEEVDRRLA